MNERPSVGRREFLAGMGTAGVASLAGCGGILGGSGGSDTVKIGVLEDRSGNFALNGTPKWRASKLAIDEINDEGGIDGKEIELFDPDPQSDDTRYAQLTKRLINQNDVDVLWAGYASKTRETIRPTIDSNEQLYFYTTQYEGGVADEYTFCMGATARQQLGSVVPYMIENFGDRIYTIAADYNFGQLSADWVKVIADENGGEVIGEEFIPLSVSNFGSTISDIQAADPDFVMALLVGKNHSSFWNQRTSAGLDIPMGTSTVMAQGYQHQRLDPPALENVYGGFNYMEEVPTDRNQDFVDRYYEKYGDDAAYINEEAVNNYVSTYLYKQAVEEAGTLDQAEVIATLEEGMEITGDQSPEGDISLQGDVHHMTHNMRVMRCDADHNITVEDTRKIPEQFLTETVDIDLSGDDDGMTKQFTPVDYFPEAGG
ncbi:urea ABC transporter substrate-binding protein [Halorhabdus sp. BNX81]|uniref:urea ABC transporter substrate-binding protein n=1 Tax=Halorhabdus sp. BNX81 TaxID=2980181 RepID=UPI0023DD52D0|nr:urea ABC transporter substrate-binding protein [Halorhabdus sp. BNX81]WEL22260.1 ABC-type branched-chain amino acid transport system, periplasmic component [Halorhabdus sp. BNX81]